MSLVEDLAVATLQVISLDGIRVLRHDVIKVKKDHLSTINAKITDAAARMLDIPLDRSLPSDDEELRQIPVGAYRTFVEARELALQPNEAKLEEAIAKFLNVLEMVPNFGYAYGQMALTQLAKYQRFSDAASLELAANNADRALALNPSSVSGLLAHAEVQLFKGKNN